MRGVVLVSCVALAGLSCSHPQNPERKDPLTDQVTGALQPTDRVFLKDDPATRVACSADAQCPKGALCHPEKRVCFTSYPEMELTKLEGTCPLVPLYFAFDSTALVPDAQRWVDYDALCLQERGARRVELDGYADARGDAAYNEDLSRRRAEAVKDALAQRGLTVDVAVRGAGESALIKGTTEHDYAYNRRVELESK
ncbi:MAG TPA: OmpA family protein [Polyangia bacterium]|jgi:outer membrane protein OmpA-like peptidoglycan-associated protein|nr:OmpA family protein [Polyangia bacterium]